MKSVRRRWPMMLALSLLSVAMVLSMVSVAYSWLYLHRDRPEAMERYLAVRPFLYSALPWVIASVLAMASGFGAYFWFKRKSRELPHVHLKNLPKNNDSLAISITPATSRNP